MWGMKLKAIYLGAMMVVALLILPKSEVSAAESAAPSNTPEQILVPPYPAAPPWKIITDRQDDKQVWIEWIPADQTTDTIRDILTEQIFFTLRGKAPGTFVNDLLNRINGACRATRRNGPNAKNELGYPVAYAQVYCVGNEGKDVDIFIKAIGGRDALYVVQREFRQPETPDAMPGITVFKKDQLAEAQARLASRAEANKFLVDQVKLCPHGASADACAGTDSAPAAPAASVSPPKSEPESMQIDGWPIPGTTTADDVREKLGRPVVENHSDPFHLGQWTQVYQGKDGVIFTFLFDKNNLVVRMQVYKYTAPH
jgi:hypothetical protein